MPDEWPHGLDYATLQKAPENFVTDQFQHREAGVLWRVRVKEDWVYSYLLIEFQRRTCHWMAVRVMTYVGLLCQDLIRRGHVLPGRGPPPWALQHIAGATQAEFERWGDRVREAESLTAVFEA